MFDLPKNGQFRSLELAASRDPTLSNKQRHPLPADPPLKPDDLLHSRPRIRDYEYQRDSGAPDIQDVLDRLENVIQSDPNVPQYSARCPSHPDHNNSLSLGFIEGTLLGHCHYGCPFDEIHYELGKPPLHGYRWPTQTDHPIPSSPRIARHSESGEPVTALTMIEVAARLRQPLQNAPDAAEDWAKLLAHFQANNDEGLIERTAQILGVDDWAVQSLGGGFDLQQLAIVFPEFDGEGRIVGLATRQGDGRKRMLPGSHRGLYLSPDSLESAEPLHCCEGPTDTAALLTMGLPAIGRPSAFGGIEFLVELLGMMPSEREIIVLGENDKKRDGRWPGREAAIKTADTLNARLGRTVQVMLPPDGAKDVRAWLQQQREAENTGVSE